MFEFYRQLKVVAKLQSQEQWRAGQDRLITEAEKVIGIPAKKWQGRCYEIACMFILKGLVPGRPVYGHYYGEVVDSDLWSSKRPFQRHGWILTPEPDPIIVDPTCWSFTQAEPCIRLFEPENMDYDEGGSSLRASMMGKFPDEDEVFGIADASQVWTLDVSSDCLKTLTVAACRKLPEKVTLGQLNWLANLPMSTLREHALEFFLFLKEHNQIALVPIDHQIAVGLVDPLKRGR